MDLAGREREGSGQIRLHYIIGFISYITIVKNFPYLHEIFRDLMFLIFLFNYFIFRDLNKHSKGKRPANPPEMARKEIDSKRKKATRLEETAMAIQLAEDKEELVKKETGIVALERRVKKQEDQLRSKANKLKKNNKTVMEAQ